MTQNKVRCVATPETIPKGEHQYIFTATYKSCDADIVVAKTEFGLIKKKIFSVISIINKQEGDGSASFLIKRLVGMAKQRRCDEIWFPNIINPKLALILKKKGFDLIKQIWLDEEILTAIMPLRTTKIESGIS